MWYVHVALGLVIENQKFNSCMTNANFNVHIWGCHIRWILYGVNIV